MEGQRQAIAWKPAVEGNLSAGSENCSDSVLAVPGDFCSLCVPHVLLPAISPQKVLCVFVQGSCSTALHVMALAMFQRLEEGVLRELQCEGFIFSI